MKEIDLNNLTKEERKNIQIELKLGNIEILNSNLFIDLYTQIKTLKNETELEKESYKKVLEHLIDKIDYEKKILTYYDTYLVYKTYKAGVLISKIRNFVERVCNTNSKNILVGTHKEKWGAIDGYLKINRKDISKKIHKYINHLRKTNRDIISTYIIENEGFSLNKLEQGKINDYQKEKKIFILNKIGKYQRNRMILKKFRKKESIVKKYIEETKSNRKKLICSKQRYINFGNFK